MENKKIKRNKTLRIAVGHFPPLVMRLNKKYKGFEIDLWEQIAQELRMPFRYVSCPFGRLLSYLKEGRADVASGGITITEEREKVVDFSHFILNTGLLVLIPKRITHANLWDILKSFIYRGYKKLLSFILIFVAFVLIFANIIWFIEKESVFSEDYLSGLFEAIWWIIVTVSTVGYGDYVPETHLGKAVGVLVIFIGYTFFAFFIAEIGSAITVKKIKSDIESYKDLNGRNVATQRHTTSVDLLHQVGAKITTSAKIKDAYKKLEQEKVEAVVFDAPVLLHYAKGEGKNKFETIGDVFGHQSYGFAVKNSNLREKINRAILKLRDNGTYDMIYQKWFGDNTKLE